MHATLTHIVVRPACSAFVSEDLQTLISKSWLPISPMQSGYAFIYNAFFPFRLSSSLF